MDITNLEHFAVTEIEDLRAQVGTLEAENASLKKTCDANRRYRIRRGEYVRELRADRDAVVKERDALKDLNAELQKERDEWRDMWNHEFAECGRLLNLCKDQQAELDRSVDQLAELTEQYEQLAKRFNALARESFGSLVKDFEPVKGAESGN